MFKNVWKCSGNVWKRFENENDCENIFSCAQPLLRFAYVERVKCFTIKRLLWVVKCDLLLFKLLSR